MGLIFLAIRAAISVYILLVFAHVLLSWFGSMQGSQIAEILDKAVEPALKPIRSVIGPIQEGAGIDFSPMVLIFALMILRGVLRF